MRFNLSPCIFYKWCNAYCTMMMMMRGLCVVNLALLVTKAFLHLPAVVGLINKASSR